MDPFVTLKVASKGMMAQSARMRIIAENLANARSTAKAPGQMPYRRRLPVFTSSFDRDLQANMVRMSAVITDKSDFKNVLEPGHPGADSNGYVKYPNVNPLIEAMDMRQAMRSYQANLNAYTASRDMVMRTIDVLKR